MTSEDSSSMQGELFNHCTTAAVSTERLVSLVVHGRRSEATTPNKFKKKKEKKDDVHVGCLPGYILVLN